MTLPLYINGRVLLRDHGGVRRYASEVANRLPATVLQPASARRPWSGRLWEQRSLAQQSSDGVLLNMAHSGPARHPRQVNVVHDLLALNEPAWVNPAYAALLRWQLPRLITNASQLVTVSAQVAREIAAAFPVSLDRIRVVPPGISDVFRPGDTATARRRLNLDPDRPVAAALFDPTPRKNSIQVAQLLHEVSEDHPELQIVVAGRATAPAFARRAQTSAGIRGELRRRAAVLDLGSAADVELATMCQAADVFVSLTAGEGFGLPAVEAAICGAAVVTTAVPSIVEHAPAAAVTISTATEARRALTGLLKDPLQRQELAATAEETLGDLRWHQTAASLGGIMSEVSRT